MKGFLVYLKQMSPQDQKKTYLKYIEISPELLVKRKEIKKTRWPAKKAIIMVTENILGH